MIEDFSLWPPLFGGVLIGLSAGLFWLLMGRIAGVSGIFGRLLGPQPESGWTWRLAFVLGLPLGAWLAMSLDWSEMAPPPHAGWPVLIAGGLLVGFGTRLGGGCTSGHGVCGLSRLSPRSIIAVLVFMAVGVVGVFITRHVLAG